MGEKRLVDVVRLDLAPEVPRARREERDVHGAEHVVDRVHEQRVAAEERARQRHPDIRFEILDAFDVRAALSIGKQFTKIYVDMSGLSGYRSLLDMISLLTMYATVFRPEAIIVKSGALKHFASNCIPWRSGKSYTKPKDTELVD